MNEKQPEQIDRAQILLLAELVREQAEQSYNADRPLTFSEMALISRSCDEIGREISKQTERHGEWLATWDKDEYICSECRRMITGTKPPFCSLCGARMDGGKSSGKD